MDAKPQRSRGLSRLRDENIPFSNVGPVKPIHQRNKSTPALTALLRPANPIQPKRSAFADVSNTSRLNGAVKDDLILSGKGAYDSSVAKDNLPVNAPTQAPPGTTTAALLRPAQRPISIFGPKSNPVPAAPSAVTAKAVGDLHVGGLVKATSAVSDVEQTNLRRLVTKRQTTVFRESESISSQDPAGMPVATGHQSLTAPAQPVAPLNTQKALPDLPKPEEQATDGVPFPPPAVPLDHFNNAEPAVDVPGSFPVLSEGNLQPSYPEVELENAQPIAEDPVISLPEGKEVVTAQESQHKISVSKVEEELLITQAVAEVDAYWDEEEEDEYFDAEGYTTARSFRSRGDNTTSGMTTVLAPRVTAAVERELAAAKVFVEQHRTQEDIEDDLFDTSMVAEYGDEIFEYMRELEERMRPNPYYMDSQNEIQWSMRSVLMDWLNQVHSRFQLLPETLFLAANYVDRFLSCKVVSLGKLQLVGATAIFVAAKYEEINCPSVQEIVYMVDGGYSMEEILKAERFMLSMLKFELGWPGPMSFLRRISKADDYDLETRTLAKYFLEVTIMDERFVACAPSFTAAGAHCLARMMLRKGDWGQAHVHYSQYTYGQLRRLMQTILECCENPKYHHGAVYDKYTDRRYKRASLFVEAELQQGFQLPSVRQESANGTTGALSWRRK